MPFNDGDRIYSSYYGFGGVVLDIDDEEAMDEDGEIVDEEYTQFRIKWDEEHDDFFRPSWMDDEQGSRYKWFYAYELEEFGITLASDTDESLNVDRNSPYRKVCLKIIRMRKKREAQGYAF